MATEEEERKAKADRAKKILAATRQKKAKAAAAASTAPNPSASSVLTDAETGTASTRTSLSVDDRAELVPPPKGEARRKKALLQDLDGKEDEAPAGETKEEDTHGVGGISIVETTPVNAAGLVDTSAKASPNIDSQSPNNLQETISHLLAERAELQSRLAARDSEVAAAQADRKLLEEGRTIIAQLEGDKRDLESRLSSLETAAEGQVLLHSELSEARKDADGLRQRHKEAEDALKLHESQRAAESEANTEKMTGLERSLERFREREGGLEKEVGRLRQRETELKTNVDADSATVGGLRSELASLAEQLSSSRSDTTSLRTELHDLTTTHAALRQTHDAVSVELDSLRTVHSSLTETLRTLETSLSISQTDLERVKATLSSEKKRADAAEKKREALQAENGVLVMQLEEVRAKVATVMEEKADLAGELDSAKGQIRRVDSDQTVKALEAEVQAATTRIQALTRQLADLQSAFTALQRERDLAAGYIGSPNRIHPEPQPPSRTSSVNRTVDAILPANVRHKRQVSLTALKARMGPSFTKGGLDALVENPGEDRRQFGDEIMFCCPACEGDLITL